MAKKSKNFRYQAKLILEELEARQLFSDGAAALAPPPTSNDVTATATTVNVDANLNPVQDNPTQAVNNFSVANQNNVAPQPIVNASNPDSPSTTSNTPPLTTTEIQSTIEAPISKELVFVDTKVSNYQALIDDITKQKDSHRQFEVIMLDANKDGITQITDILANNKNLNAVHLITHGSDGSLDIGNSQLNFQTLIQHQEDISTWKNAFTDQGDFLIYGCNVAQTQFGQGFVDYLSNLTQTDIAASEDATGFTGLGADWNLEYQSGAIEAEGAVSLAMQDQWADVLAVTSNSTVSSSSSTSTSSLTWAHTVSSGSNRALFVQISIDAANVNATSVTYGGVALTLVGRTTGSHAVEIWTLVNPTVGTANVVVNLSGTSAVAAGASTFNGVNQSTPTGTFVGNSGSGIPILFFPVTGSVTVSSAVGDLVIDAQYWSDSNAVPTGAGQTAQWTHSSFWSSALGSSTTEAGAASVTMSGSDSALISLGVDWSIGAVSIKAAVPGITVTPTSGLTTTEAGGTVQFSVVLNTPPTANVTIGLSSSDLTEGTVSPSSLTFTTANWNTPQIVTVTGVDDALVDGNISYSIITAAATSSDSNYNGLNAANVSISNTDNDNSLTVDTTSDVLDGNTGSIALLFANKGADGKISLREAITAANATPNGATPDRIIFNIPAALVGGVHTITLSYDGPDADTAVDLLPDITGAVIIDASTEPDWATSSKPVVLLNGNNAVTDGLRLYTGSSGSTIRGLVIQNFTQDGIDIANSNGNTVAGNYIGTNAAGTVAAGNSQGINLWNADNNILGGTSVADRNIISGNTYAGIYIGTDNGTGTGNQIIGNYIGTNSNGDAAVANNRGIEIISNNNTIGGIVANSKNVISGNNFAGVYLNKDATKTGAGASGNIVSGNYIGTNAAGTGDINGTTKVNGVSGVVMTNGANNNRVGTNADGLNDIQERNIISGNNWYGVEMIGNGTNNNLVQGNYIGTDYTGQVALGNSLGGVSFWNNAANNQLGSGLTGAGNVISANETGVLIANGVINNKVQGNFIGLAADGLTALGNTGVGVYAYNGGTASAVTGNIIGTDADGNNDTGERNIISANFRGVAFENAEVTGNFIAGNYIGTDSTGLLDRGNTLDGVLILNGANSNTIGGSSATQRNIISGNNDDGIQIDGEASDGNIIQNNWIGLASNGTTVLGNSGDGIFVNGGADNTTIGGINLGNVIMGSGLVGIEIDGTSTGTVIQGNYIGTNLAGTVSFGSQQNGVLLENGASNSSIGGTLSGQSNVITDSGRGGTFTAAIDINPSAGTGIQIIANSIYGNPGIGIDLGVNGVTDNDNLDPDTGTNNLQNFPVITSATTSGTGIVKVSGTINTLANLSGVIIQLYATPSAGNPTGRQGKRYLGSTTVNTDASGNATFTNIALSSTVATGEILTATTTYDNSTSEFSQGVTINGPNIATSDLYSIRGISESSLIGVYGFNNIDNLGRDDAGNNAPITLVGSPGQTITPVGSGALDLAGGASGQYGDITGITTGGAMTIAGSVRFDSTGDWQRVFDFGQTGAAGLGNIYVSRLGNSSDLTFTIEKDSGSGLTSYRAIATNAITNGTWLHFAATVDASGTMKLYINGSLAPNIEASIAGVAPDTGIRTNNYIGKSAFTAGDALFDGAIDNFVVANGAMSATDVLALYQQTIATAFTVAENAANGTVVGAVVALDVDASANPAYSLTDSAGGRFAINSTNGTITVLDGSLLDYESATSHSIIVQVTDSGGASYSEIFTVNLSNVVETVTVTNLSASEKYSEDTPLNLTDIVITRGDSPTVTATLTLSNTSAGSLNTATSGAVTSTYNASTGVWTANGAVANVNTLLANLTFTPATNFNSNFTIATSVSDGTTTLTGTKTMTGTALNDEPVNTIPTAQTTNEDTAKVFSSANGNQIAITDVDAAGGNNEITLTVTNGTLTLSGVAGLAFTVGDGTADSTMTFRGTAVAINTALNGLIYIPTANYNGSSTLTLRTLDSTLLALNIDANLQARYTFEGNVNDVAAGTVQNGTLVGNATYATDGTRGQVLTLDGSGDSVQITSTFGQPQNVTIGGWVKLSAGTGRKEFISIDDRVHIALDDAGGVKGSVQVSAGVWTDLNSNQFIAGTGWHHVMYVFNGASDVHTLYIDGAQVATAANTNSIYYTGATTTYIGQHPTNTAWNLNGLVDDVRIYDRALSGSEVAALSADLSLVDTDTVSVTITAVNDAPTTSLVTLSSINEDSGGRIITQAELLANATDVEGNALTAINLSIASGSGSLVNNGNGTWTFTPTLNDDTAASFSYTITDGNGGSVSGSANLDILAVNDAPLISSNGGGSTGTVNVAENQTNVTTVTVSDVDLPVQTISYSIIGGTDAALFTINASTGALQFISGRNFESPTDTDANNIYEVIVQASDGAGGTDTQTISISVTPINEAAPVITSNGGGATAAINITENTTGVTIVTATDNDLPTPTLSYSISGGADAAKFTINSSTGVLSFLATPNYETPTDVGLNNIYDLTVMVSDGSLTSTQSISVTVTNLDEVAPTITSGTTASVINENSGANQVIYTATSTDVGDTATGSTSYSLGGTDAALFSIDTSTGEVTLTGNPNYEVKASYSFTVTATDAAGNASAAQTVTLAINNLDEVAPTITSGTTASAINENSGANQVIYTATSTDVGDTATGSTSYSLGGTDASLFTINSATGAVTLLANPNFETKASYSFTVTATDAAGNASAAQTVTLAINNLDEVAPTITSGTTASAINENSGANQVIYTATSTDVGDTATGSTSYSLGGTDASLFTINSATGAVTLLANPNFETKASYSFTVTATDAAGNASAAQTVTLAINNLDEVAPTITSGTTASAINENSGANQVIYTATSTDVGDTATGSTSYSLGGYRCQSVYDKQRHGCSDFIG